MGEWYERGTVTTVLGLTVTSGLGGALRVRLARQHCLGAPPGGWRSELLDNIVKTKTEAVPWLPERGPRGHVRWPAGSR